MRRQSLFSILRVQLSLSLPVLLCLICVTYSAPSARADNQVRAVRLSNVVGSVQILNGTGSQFSQAYPNMPLMQGSKLQTGEDGRAEVQFEDGSIVRLTPNSSLMFTQLTRDSSGNTATEVDLLTGLSYVEMSGAPNQRFSVHLGPNEVTTISLAKFRVNLDANPPELSVLDGTAHVANANVYFVDVKQNETIRFDASDPSRYFLAQGIDGDSWDQWNADRDQALARMGAQETREARLNGNPNNPAWNDLDYYGDWYSMAGNGYVWSPYGAGAGWDPYGMGYWGSYGGGGGYGWVSAYPWGWLPYSCGAWNYYGGFGWGWSPYGCGAGGYVPTVIVGNCPPGYRKPVPPSQRGQLPGRIVAVNRGPEATYLAPRNTGLQSEARLAMVNGHPLQPVLKTANPRIGVAAGPVAQPISRPVGHTMDGSQQLSSIPAYRPVAPSSAYHPASAGSTSHSNAAPSYAGGSSSASSPSMHSSASSSSSMSSASHSSSAPAPSGGGHAH